MSNQITLAEWAMLGVYVSLVLLAIALITVLLVIFGWRPS
ncbi:hypothetical protein LCGC14_0658250 [marine sediment metagenome]|uniref:Uncharacterized protein n=1 Tax=marine sediment metagenome TaxID=412755 RepID=A0A0F9TG43_9ZZZZ